MASERGCLPLLHHLALLYLASVHTNYLPLHYLPVRKKRNFCLPAALIPASPLPHSPARTVVLPLSLSPSLTRAIFRSCSLPDRQTQTRVISGDGLISGEGHASAQATPRGRHVIIRKRHTLSAPTFTPPTLEGAETESMLALVVLGVGAGLVV